MFLFHECHVIIREVHHSVWGKASGGINVCWAFPQVVFCPLARAGNFQERRIERYLRILIEKGLFNCMRDDVVLVSFIEVSR